jgi:hypothetical protein
MDSDPEFPELDGLRLFEQVWNGTQMAHCPDRVWSMVVHMVWEGPDGSQRGPKWGIPSFRTTPDR